MSQLADLKTIVRAHGSGWFGPALTIEDAEEGTVRIRYKVDSYLGKSIERQRYYLASHLEQMAEEGRLLSMIAEFIRECQHAELSGLKFYSSYSPFVFVPKTIHGLHGLP